MKKAKKILLKSSVVLFLIVIVLAPVPALEGGKNGLLLWFNTLLPTLLPFIIISNIIIKLNITDYICFLFGPVMKRLFRVSLGGCYPIIIGILSGFPIGAKSSADLVRCKKISPLEGQFLIALCNNASIMFITGYIAISKLQQPNQQYILLAIILLSSVLSSFLYRIGYEKKHSKQSTSSYYTTKDTNVAQKNPPFSFQMIDDSILDGFEVITKIGGYVILFSILAQIILSVLPGTGLFKLIVVGLLEVTTGIHYISSSGLPEEAVFIIICGITAFGGFSSIAQTKSVLYDTSLSIGHYIKTKFISGIIAILLASLYLFFR